MKPQLPDGTTVKFQHLRYPSHTPQELDVLRGDRTGVLDAIADGTNLPPESYLDPDGPNLSLLATTAELRTLGLVPHPRGGRTYAFVLRDTDDRDVSDADRLLAIGVANCHVNDNFSRRLGRDIALGRAVLNLRQQRQELRA